MRSTVKTCFAANTILLMRNWNLVLERAKLGDRMIKQLLNSVIAKYRDLSVSRRSIICLSLRHRELKQ